MKKIFSLLLSVLMMISVVFSFSSCNRSYDEAEVKAAALILIPKSVPLNEIFWGEGIPYFKNSSTSNGAYHEANYLELEKYGFETVEELKKMASDVFSDAYCENIFSTIFSSVEDEDGIQSMARYYQKYSDKNNRYPEAIMVYEYAENLLPDEVEYNYDTLTVTHSKKDRVYVELEVKITKDEEHVQTRTKRIALVEDADGWKIDSATYIKYNEQESQYEDLLDKNK